MAYVNAICWWYVDVCWCCTLMSYVNAICLWCIDVCWWFMLMMSHGASLPSYRRPKQTCCYRMWACPSWGRWAAAMSYVCKCQVHPPMHWEAHSNLGKLKQLIDLTFVMNWHYIIITIYKTEMTFSDIQRSDKTSGTSSVFHTSFRLSNKDTPPWGRLVATCDLWTHSCTLITSHKTIIHYLDWSIKAPVPFMLKGRN